MKKIILLLIFLILPFIFSCNEIIKLPKNYNITYHLNNGEEDISLSILENEILEKIDDPIYNGYIFKGWYIDDTLLEEYNFNKKITSDLDLYAKWEKEVEVIESIVPVFTGLSINNTQNGRRAKNDDITAEVEEYGGFAQVNEDILINIHIDNPSEYVILRFILNGVTYQSYQFEEGSNSSIIKLKVNVGDVPGKVSFEIDEIKYVDDADNLIKDVKMVGEKIISVGITYDILPECKDIDISKTEQSIELNCLIEDYYKLANNNIYLYFFKDNELLERYALNIGANSIVIENLKVATEYNVVISATYDCLNGLGRKSFTLFEEIIQTNDLELITFNDFNVSYHTVEYQYSTDHQDVIFDKIEVFTVEDNRKYDHYNEITTKINDLNDNVEYRLVVYSHAFISNEMINRKYEYTFKTLEVPTPSLEEFILTEITDSSVSFDYVISFDGNDDLYCEVANIFIKDDDYQFKMNLDNKFDGLGSSKKYVIEIICIYGVVNQSGYRLCFEKEFETLELIPHLSLISFFIQDTYVEYRIANTYVTEDIIEVYKDDQLVLTNDYRNYILDSLEPNTDYVAKFKYHYTDDNGQVVYDELVKEFKTREYFVPQIYIEYGHDIDTLYIEPIYHQDKNKIEIQSVILYHNNVEVKRIKDFNHLTFYNVEPGLTYVVEITYKAIVKNKEVIFKASEVIEMPKRDNSSYAKAINLEVTYNSVKFELYKYDPNNNVNIRKVALSLDNEIVQTLDDLDNLEFKELFSYKRYAVVVYYTITNGEGIRYYDCYTFFDVPAVEEGTASLELDVDRNSVSYIFDYDNEDIFRGIKSVQLYSNNELVASYDNLEENIITNLEYNTKYRLIIAYKVYYNSTSDDVRSRTIRKDFQTPLEFIPKVYIENPIYDQTSISFDIKYNDPEKVVSINYLSIGTDRYEVYRYYSYNIPKKVEGLLSNNYHEIYINYSYYDMGEKIDFGYTYTFYTTSYEVPTVDINANVLGNEINGDLIINDEYNIGYIKSIKLYLSDVLIAEDDDLSDLSFSFSVSEKGNYTIQVKYAYDLNEGLGEEVLKDTIEVIV